MIEILLVEDDPALSRGTSVKLELEGYKVHCAANLKEANELNSKKKLNLVLLDWNLPDGSGLNFLKTIRETGSRIPVIMLTAKTDEDSVVDGLQSGANDYVRKPFGSKELLARIKTVLGESNSRDEQLRCGDLLVLLNQRRVIHKGSEVELNRREFDILSYFVQNAGKVVTREALMNAVNKDGEIFDRTIDSHISHVRTRLRQSGVQSIEINSVYGVGYRLEKKS
jgi:DNA-binding response OmpR family regulator